MKLAEFSEPIVIWMFLIGFLGGFVMGAGWLAIDAQEKLNAQRAELENITWFCFDEHSLNVDRSVQQECYRLKKN
jgi:hypothetical protein